MQPFRLLVHLIGPLSASFANDRGYEGALGIDNKVIHYGASPDNE